MPAPEGLRVFVDAHGVEVPRGATALDAVAVFDADAAASVRSGEKILTDSRGLPIDAATTVEAGAIFRLIPRRDRSAPPKVN
jgi:hypothetical protein